MKEFSKELQDKQYELAEQNVALWERIPEKFTSGVSEFDDIDGALDFIIALHEWGGFVGHAPADGSYVHWICPLDTIPEYVVEGAKT